MRNAIFVAILFAVACPLAARADLTLRHPVFTDGVAGAAAGAHLVPPLRLGDVALDTGSGAGGGTEPVLALVLGIFPGFGLGHYVAGAPWEKWAVIDTLLLVGLVVAIAADLGVFEALAWIATIVERVIEGLDAFKRAGGRIGAATRRSDTRLAAAPPGAVRAAAGHLPDAARPPEVVLARF